MTIIEIQKLQGLNLNPLVEIQCGDDKKMTTCKESTNCPYYDEVGLLTLQILLVISSCVESIARVFNWCYTNWKGTVSMPLWPLIRTTS